MFSEHVQSRAAKRAATRRTVLTSAEKLFREQGFSTTTVRQIAADAGVSTGTVMANGDKEGLLVAIFDGWIAAVHQSRGGAGRGEGRLTRQAATDEVAQLFEPFLTYFGGDEDLAREYAAIIVRGKQDSSIFHRLGDALTSEVEDLLARADVRDAGLGARVIYLAYLGIIMTASNGAITATEASEELEHVIRIVLARPGPQE
jgi:AcrR family transcriptional regulator